MVCDCWKAPEDSVSHGLCKQRLGGVSPKLKYMCKQKRRGMICLWVEITSFMGAALESLVDKHLSKLYFYALYMISKLKKL